MLQETQQVVSGLKLLEISAGGIFAVILIDKVLGWALKFRGRNGNGKSSFGDREIAVLKAVYERPEFIKHNGKVDTLASEVGKLCETLESRKEIFLKLLDSAVRQERLLEGIRDKITGVSK